MDDTTGFCRRKSTRGGDASVTTQDVVVEANRAKEAAKYESQQTTIITSADIQKKQAKSVEDVIFSEAGVSRTVDAMGRVGVSIRGAEPRHTLILVDGQPVMGDFSKYYGSADELLRQGTENVDHIEIIQGAASAKYGSDAIGGVINIITKKPAKTAGLQVNVEGTRVNGDSGTFPYQNVFLRADSGQMGKVRTAIFGSKRDIMPIHDTDSIKTIYMGDFMNTIFGADMKGYKNSLRYYGPMNTLGLATEYDVNDHNTLGFNLNRFTEDLHRESKHTNLILEPFQQFKRTSTRDTYGLNWKGNNQGNTDWNVELNYARMNEDDVTVTSDYQKSIYEGKDTLNYVDNIDHRQYDFKASANTQVNDDHLLTYGMSYTYEKGEGSRLKNAPNTTRRAIDPWDYDKSLGVDKDTGEPNTTVHDYIYTPDAKGILQWNSDKEYYNADTKEQAATFTYGDYVKYFEGANSVNSYSDKYAALQQQDTSGSTEGARQEAKDALDRLAKFNAQLAANPENSKMAAILGNTYMPYAGAAMYYDKNFFFVNMFGQAKLNGMTFKQLYDSLKNQQTVGEASIRKQSVFLQDTWQVNRNTILSPIIRLDHSSIFGSNVTANMGLTHNLAGNPHRRLKANLGTGYTEPGMGELYYNWEMYSGNMVNPVAYRMGWYWVGNPDLKPEKSVNMDISIEGENKNTTARAGFFYNRIRNYMTTYFTGGLMDFHPEYKKDDLTLSDVISVPDMIYSFKNIGRAEITGFEASVEQKLGSKWSAKLGYTWLNAINKSDSDMPRQLLDKPQHKIDIGISYDDKESGWSGSLWGDYYIHMLDSNSVANNGNYLTLVPDPDHLNPYFGTPNLKVQTQFAEGGKQTYQKKTFGIWNFIVQKQLGKDAKVYFGIDNIFNHHDYDRALQERVYKVGLNMKFGYDAASAAKAHMEQVTGRNESAVAKALQKGGLMDDFIQAPFDTMKKQGVEVIGDYRARWDSFTGSDKPNATVTADTIVGDAAKNVLDKANHGFEQRLRLGVDARLGENTNVKVLGSASGMTGVDTKYDISDSRGFGKSRLDTVDLTQHANKWDFSIGRLTEPMGITGYWFGKEYDGARAVWTSGKSQVRVGYGDFKQSTGIADSAYTHAIRQVIFRAPTVEEFLGLDNAGMYMNNSNLGIHDYGNTTIKKDTINFYQQLKNAQTDQEKMNIIKNMWSLVTKAYGMIGYPNASLVKMPDDYDTNGNYKYKYQTSILMPGYITLGDIPFVKPDNKYLPSFTYSYIDAKGISHTGTGLGGSTAFKNNINPNLLIMDNRNGAFLDTHVDKNGKITSKAFESWFQKNGPELVKAYETMMNAQLPTGAKFTGWIDDTGDKVDLSEMMYQKLQNIMYDSSELEVGKESVTIPNILKSMLGNIAEFLQYQEDGSSLPRGPLGEVTGNPIQMLGTVLQKDTIPPIQRATFVQAKHQLSKDFGVQAWWLKRMGDDTHTYEAAHGQTNDVASFDQLANVIGIGAKWAVGDKATISFDYGQNRTDFGRYMNGTMAMKHIPYSPAVTDMVGNVTTPAVKDHYEFQGRDKGGTPHFWVARVDIGKSDMDVVGSWNAFADYKYFQHGSFFGGNGTESLPDRYLDGIRSFTIGGGYVPAKNLLLEAFYTFDAQGIGKRATLYGTENFSLGDYTRVQVSYKF